MYSSSKQSTKHNSTSVKWVYIYCFGVNLIYMLEQFTCKECFAHMCHLDLIKKVYLTILQQQKTNSRIVSRT